MSHSTIVSLLVVILSLVMVRFLFQLAVMAISYTIFYIVPLIFINVCYLLVWIIRPDYFYADLKLFINDRKTQRLGFLDFLNRFLFIPGL